MKGDYTYEQIRNVFFRCVLNIFRIIYSIKDFNSCCIVFTWIISTLWNEDNSSNQIKQMFYGDYKKKEGCDTYDYSRKCKSII